MNLHFFGLSSDPKSDKANEPFEHPERAVFPNLVESLEEGDEYADDELRMTDQPFGQD